MRREERRKMKKSRRAVYIVEKQSRELNILRLEEVRI